MIKNMSIILSEHFRLTEFTTSLVAVTRRIDNTPPLSAVSNLQQLCLHVLEPLRAHLGHAVRINSGYRSPRLNAAVGGVKTSDHTRGCAADIFPDFVIAYPKKYKSYSFSRQECKKQGFSRIGGRACYFTRLFARLPKQQKQPLIIKHLQTYFEKVTKSGATSSSSASTSWSRCAPTSAMPSASTAATARHGSTPPSEA